MSVLTVILYFIYAFIFLKLGVFLLNRLNTDLTNAIFNRRLELGILSMEDFHKFGLDRFLLLSRLYLEDLGMCNITSASTCCENVDFVCEFRNEKVFVQCILEDLSSVKDTDSEIYSVHIPDIQRFLGQMVHDNIKIGIILTNACCSKESMNFIEQQKGNHRLLLIDGYQFTKRIKAIKELNGSLGGAMFE